MATRDHYMSVARKIADHLNAFHQAFKTYNVSEFTEMLKVVAGEGARATTEETAQQLKSALLERGFTIFPEISEAEDGYVRVIRTNTIVGSLLNAFRYVGPSGDAELIRLLGALKRRQRPDDLELPTDSEG